MTTPKTSVAKKSAPKKAARNASAIAANRPALAASGKLHLFTTSEARREWKDVISRALAGERVTIMVGKQALALRPVELTYAEEEYEVTPTELHGKAQEILKRARKERAAGKTGSGAGLL